MPDTNLKISSNNASQFNLKKGIPITLKNLAKTLFKTVRFFSTSQRLKKQNYVDKIPDNLINKLYYSWDNTGWSLSIRAIKDIVLTSSHINGPILECGSGLSTIILGIMHRHNQDITIYALEHDAAWYNKVNRWIKILGLKNIRLINTQLIQYPDFDWYDISGLAIPKNILLVICDGPPGTTRGGRYGLIPVMKKYLSDNVTIFLDDTIRLAEKSLINKWSDIPKIRIENVFDKTEYCIFSIVKEETIEDKIKSCA